MFTPVSTPADSLSGSRFYLAGVLPEFRESGTLTVHRGKTVAVFDSGAARPARVADGALWIQAPGEDDHDQWELAAVPGIIITGERVVLFDHARTPGLNEFLTAGDYYAEVLDELDNGSRVEVYARL